MNDAIVEFLLFTFKTIICYRKNYTLVVHALLDLYTKHILVKKNNKIIRKKFYYIILFKGAV